VALLDLAGESERSRDGAAFSNGFEGESWMSLWCFDGCVYEPDCPLIMVAMLDQTPGPWVERDPTSLNRYTCTEYDDGTTA
jgi:hypothetical protein